MDHLLALHQEGWLTKEEFKSWLRKIEEKQQKVYCIIWIKRIDIANGGSSSPTISSERENTMN